MTKDDSWMAHPQLKPVDQIDLGGEPFDAHCCHTGTAIRQTGLSQSFVIFDIWALWRSGLSVRVHGCQKLQMMA